MGRIEDIKQQVQALSPEELAQFRAWFLEFDWAVWDRQLARDVHAGRLDALAERGSARAGLNPKSRRPPA